MNPESFSDPGSECQHYIDLTFIVILHLEIITSIALRQPCLHSVVDYVKFILEANLKFLSNDTGHPQCSVQMLVRSSNLTIWKTPFHIIFNPLIGCHNVRYPLAKQNYFSPITIFNCLPQLMH